MCEYRETVLVIDDDELFRDELCAALQGNDCRVHAFGNLDTANQELSTGFSPSVVFADRRIDGEPIEGRLLFEIRESSPDSLVVIYTRIDDLTDAQVADILSMGATRVLDRSQIAGSVDLLLHEFRELKELSLALQELTQGRSKLLTALIGTDVGVTMIDHQSICWFTNSKHQEIVGAPCTKGLCSCSFYGQPPEFGSCWGCGVRDVFKETISQKRAINQTVLTRLRNNEVCWLSIQTKPIFGLDGKRVIAATEAVSLLEDSYVNSIEPNEVLFSIARGLLRTGFGRVRIYREHAEEGAHRLVAAASRKDRFEENAYFDELDDLDVNYTKCPYSVRACASKMGLLVKEWGNGPTPFENVLGLELPYFLLPIRDHKGKTLLGLLAADFIGWENTRAKPNEKSPREVAEANLAGPETLKWIHDGYCR